MLGGAGDDTYVVDSTSDVVTEGTNAGTDTVQSSATYTLGGNVEHLTLTGTDNINATGNTLDNMLTGNVGDNILTAVPATTPCSVEPAMTRMSSTRRATW